MGYKLVDIPSALMYKFVCVLYVHVCACEEENQVHLDNI